MYRQTGASCWTSTHGLYCCHKLNDSTPPQSPYCLFSRSLSTDLRWHQPQPGGPPGVPPSPPPLPPPLPPSLRPPLPPYCRTSRRALPGLWLPWRHGHAPVPGPSHSKPPQHHPSLQRRQECSGWVVVVVFWSLLSPRHSLTSPVFTALARVFRVGRCCLCWYSKLPQHHPSSRRWQEFRVGRCFCYSCHRCCCHCCHRYCYRCCCTCCYCSSETDD